MQGEDPDFQRTIKKVVWYKDFIKFVQLLPERDALIAKLLYFGAPTMDEVLSLRVDQIDSRKGLVKFKKFSVKYPKHVMLELKSSLTQKKKEDLKNKKISEIFRKGGPDQGQKKNQSRH